MLCNDFLGKLLETDANSITHSKTYNFVINIEEIEHDSDVNQVIKLRKEYYSDDKETNKMLSDDYDQEVERIKDLYIRQITRVLRLLYFITLK